MYYKLITVLAILSIDNSYAYQQLIVIRGLPGSGKSTFAKEYVESHKNAIHIEKDMIRKDICGDKWSQCVTNRNVEIIAMQTMMTSIVSSLMQGKDVVVAGTHLEDKMITLYQELADNLNAQLIIVDLRRVKPEVCIENDAKRQVQSVISIKDLYEKHIQGKLK